MRTLLVTNDFPPKVGGIQSYLLELLSCLPPCGVRVLAPTHPEAGAFDASLPYEVVRWPRPRLYPTPGLVRRVSGLAAGTDVVQYGYALQSWLVAPAVLRRTGVPYAIFVHGAEVLLPLRLPGAAGLLVRGTLGRAAAVISVSRHTAAGVEGATGIGCPVLPPPVDLERFRPPPGARERARRRYGLGGRPVVLCVSRLAFRKGQDRLIDAMPPLARRFGARLLLVGEGPRAGSLRRRARRRGVAGAVVFAGRVPAGELPACYAAADVFAAPVRDRWLGLEQEGFGVVFAEAAAAGLPAVVGASGGAREAVEDGVTGYLVDGRSAAAVGKALARLLGDAGLRERMGRAARGRAAELYGRRAVGRRYRSILERAAGGGGA
ncbi:glycosyl transferase, group 1 [Rubrobacter xylanophilus DSM 9941]|uniref:Glycosyl transferase, group 1 n=1 Tax=Rubrobacter xylanophilus (strain DSM 9941 / JCM 11954 / NBRC 16129 / PRD-1) TaxID=266117 RepID=Q1AZ19_RUBXD|nr:glycosyltransferase family 4 protein [Rubrobacter xylanophilus]ABG03359.1 glycosyl transferase, group 1 [Rubrobacter xylanophilus DSM 9941]